MNGKGPIVLFVISGLVMAFVAYVSFLPETVVVKVAEKSTMPAEDLLAKVGKAEAWKSWYFLAEDSSRKFMKLQGVTNGFKWFSELEGDGAIEIIGKEENKVHYHLILDNNQFRSAGVFEVENTSKGSLIKWTDTLDVSTSVMGRMAAKSEDFVKRIEKHNLKTLQRIVAQ